MPTTTSIKSSARLARLVVIATSVTLLGVGLRDERADACGGGEWWSIADLTTFDPKVLGDAHSLYYDPQYAHFGEACDSCAIDAIAADWKSYFGANVLWGDWKRVLYDATSADLIAISLWQSGKGPAPKGWDHSTVWKQVPKDKILGALAFVQVARKIEKFASFSGYDASGNQRPSDKPPDDLLAQAKAAAKTKDPFLAQRYAFQVMRTMFYRRDWREAIAFHDQWAKVLSAPSNDLAWRSRHYLAGALARNGNKARANLELSRIHAGYPALANVAVNEFLPMENKDFNESLKLAKTVREKTELWRLVGVKKDGVVAMQEIIKLDVKSNLIGLLLVRELAKAESRVTEYYGKPDPKDVSAQTKTYATLEQIATSQLAKGGDRPWLLELVAGHIAAKRGDVVGARARLARATAARPGDIRVASQAKASLAMALVGAWKISPQLEEELALTMNGIDKEYGRRTSVRAEVRKKLAKEYLAAGHIVDAEFLKPGSVPAPAKGAKPKWNDAVFIRDMIARTAKTQTAFDKFVLTESFTKPNLEQDLAMRLILDGDFTGAAKVYQVTKPTSLLLKTDPFVMHIKDCHDCDHEKYASAKWTHANVAAKLAELDQKVKGGGEAGAEAALQIGNVLYNMTWYGNARVMLDESHQATRDASAALAWYKRAHDMTKNRELKVKAAFFAAKAELGNALTAAQTDVYAGVDPLPMPKTWFPIVKQYANTKYYKEVLKECGHFASWAKKN